MGILKYIEYIIQINLEYNILGLKYKIFDYIFEIINFVFILIVIYVVFNLFCGIIVIFGYLIVIFIWFVNVNFIDWWKKIVDEIYDIIVKNEIDILNIIEVLVYQMCR